MFLWENIILRHQLQKKVNLGDSLAEEMAKFGADGEIDRKLMEQFGQIYEIECK